MRALVVAFGFALAATATAASDRPEPQLAAAVVEQPRPFGYVVGDLLTQRVLLEAGGRSVEAAQLPTPGRVGIWFERRSARVERRPDGRQWLAVEYQVINAPPSLRTIHLPAWDLKTPLPGPTLRVAEWPITVGPLTRAGADSAPSDAPSSGGETVAAGNPVRLRPDRAAPLVPTASIRQNLLLWSSGFTVALAAWLAWLLWRNHAESGRLPFARALREIQHADERAPEAWQALHRAFDRTAGRVVQPQSLSALFAQAPYLRPLRTSIEAFFAQSSERFFGGGLPAQPISTYALCRDLRRLEKRAAR
jgi:mxaA protein